MTKAKVKVLRAWGSQRTKGKREEAKDKTRDMYLQGIEIVRNEPPDVCDKEEKQTNSAVYFA